MRKINTKNHNVYDYFGYLRFGLKRKGFAKSKKGKLSITPLGRERLKHLKQINELRRSRIVKASGQANTRKKVLFVCPCGMESSLLGMNEFIRAAKANPLSHADLELDFCGWLQEPKGIFEKKILGSDFIIPMGEAERKKIESAIGKSRFGPKIIDAGFRGFAEQYEKQRYEKILETIRAQTEKEKK